MKCRIEPRSLDPTVGHAFEDQLQQFTDSFLIEQKRGDLLEDGLDQSAHLRKLPMAIVLSMVPDGLFVGGRSRKALLFVAGFLQ